VPSLGAVLHTLNLRLDADQIAYIADHAEDRVVIVDGSLVELFAKILPKLNTVHTVAVRPGMAADGRHCEDRCLSLHNAHGSGEGRHQVRGRVDLLSRPGALDRHPPRCR
jgi:acyl-CoA synthetase (AMP-forming)/AMP-acid ligase II